MHKAIENTLYQEDAISERAWYFTKGTPLPAWLVESNIELFAGADLLVTSRNGGYEIRPQNFPMGLSDSIIHGPNPDKVAHVFVKGGGNGIAIIGRGLGAATRYDLEISFKGQGVQHDDP